MSTDRAAAAAAVIGAAAPSLVGTVWDDTRAGRQQRAIRITGRTQARETLATPVVWEAETVDRRSSSDIGRVTYVSDRTLRAAYRRRS